MYSLNQYSKMLAHAKAIGYEFILFGDVASLPKDHTLKCLLRHDIDCDIHAALEMAKVEAALNIRATYFFMTRSPVYNLSARHNHDMVLEIISLGHSIALHFDQGFNGGDHMTETQWIEKEAEWLENSFNVTTDVVSFHQPGPAVMQGEVNTGNRINTYNALQLPGFSYYSDSNRVFTLLNTFATDRTIDIAYDNVLPSSFQLLIHPMWWVYEDATTDEVWNRVIENNFEMSQQQFLKTERAYGYRRSLSLNPFIADRS